VPAPELLVAVEAEPEAAPLLHLCLGEPLDGAAIRRRRCGWCRWGRRRRWRRR
jgi:hypothetical protein